MGSVNSTNKINEEFRFPSLPSISIKLPSIPMPSIPIKLPSFSIPSFPSLSDIINGIVTPIINKFKNLFEGIDFVSIFKDTMKSISKFIPYDLSNKFIKSIIEIYEYLSKLKDKLNVDYLFGKFKEGISFLFDIFIKFVKTIFNYMKEKFVKYKDKFMSIANYTVDAIKKKAIELYDSFTESTKGITDIMKKYAESGIELFSKYIKPLLTDLFESFLYVMFGLYDFIKDRIKNKDKKTIYTCILPFLSQIDDVMFGSFVMFYKPFIRNKMIENPQCKIQLLENAAIGRKFVQRYYVISVIAIILLYFILIVSINRLTETINVIPKGLLLIFTIFLYLNIVSDKKAAYFLINIIDNVNILSTSKISKLYKQNYTLFIFTIILLLIEIKLIIKTLLNLIIKH